jgi:hypothetical protein
MKPSKASIGLLAVQLVLVSSIAVKYLYQRQSCPRVWTRAVAYDPELLMRGRYLSAQLVVDGCQSTLPSARQAAFPRTVNGIPNGDLYSVNAAVEFPARLTVKDGRLLAIRIPTSDEPQSGQMVSAFQGMPCDKMRLAEPANFYIAEHATSPLPRKAKDELWMEVTVPPKGPPRPIQLALKTGRGEWKPLAFQ